MSGDHQRRLIFIDHRFIRHFDVDSLPECTSSIRWQSLLRIRCIFQSLICGLFRLHVATKSQTIDITPVAMKVPFTKLPICWLISCCRIVLKFKNNLPSVKFLPFVSRSTGLGLRYTYRKTKQDKKSFFSFAIPIVKIKKDKKGFFPTEKSFVVRVIGEFHKLKEKSKKNGQLWTPECCSVFRSFCSPVN